jgi:ribonuclease VapC
MTVFVDASAIVAMMTKEPAAQVLFPVLNANTECLTSCISVWEAAASVSRKTGESAVFELDKVLDFLSAGRVNILAAEANILNAALAAFDRYGRRSGHPAQLNMGDCFAYAYAKKHAIPLLYVGNDFSRTDVTRASI